MPIVVDAPVTGAPFGPGFLLQVSNTTIGPFLDPNWRIVWTPDDGFDGEILQWTYAASSAPYTISEFFPQRLQIPFPTAHARQNTTGHLTVNFYSGSELAETTAVVVQAEWLIGTQWQLGQKANEAIGALTPTQAQQLEETHASTFPAISVDTLGLLEITNGPQGGFASAFLSDWIFGVIVRIATVPPEFHVDTPDGDYWTKTLAVVRIYRGSDLWKRVPVHTSSKMISFVEEGIVSAVTSILPIQWLVQMSVQVSFADGVTGQAYTMYLP